MKSKFGIGIERILLNEKEIEKEREMKSPYKIVLRHLDVFVVSLESQNYIESAFLIYKR